MHFREEDVVTLNPVDSTNDTSMAQPVTFDSEKCLNCSIEASQVLVHSSGGKGYCLGTTAMVSGCYKWKVEF